MHKKVETEQAHLDSMQPYLEVLASHAETDQLDELMEGFKDISKQRGQDPDILDPLVEEIAHMKEMGIFEDVMESIRKDGL